MDSPTGPESENPESTVAHGPIGGPPCFQKDLSVSPVLIDALPHAVFFIRNQRVIYANVASLEAFGLSSPENFLGLDVAGFIAEEDRDRILTYSAARLRGDWGVPAVYTAQLRRGDGSVFTGVICAHVMSYEGESAIQVTILDISGQEAIQKKLRQHALENKAILEANRKLQQEIAERLRVETALLTRNEQSRQFQSMLQTLHEVFMELAGTETFDALCRCAIELGRSRLGFERLGLWLFTDDGQILVGSYGTDETGQLRDERGIQLPITLDSTMSQVYREKIPLIKRDHVPIYALDLQVLGYGNNATATMWDGDKVIGILGMDTFLSGAPIADETCELLMMYATTVGHLCTIKRQETLLRNRETQLAAAQRIGHMGNWIQNLALNEIALSDEACRILGVNTTDSTISKKELLLRVHPEERQALNDLEQRAIQGEMPYDIEYRLFRPDGSECWVRCCAEIVKNPQGMPEELVGTIQDVTEEHRIQESLYRRLKIMELVAERAAQFVKLNPEALDEAVSQVVESLARFQHVDWAIFAMIGEKNKSWSHHWQWFCPEVFSPKAPVIHTPDMFPWIENILWHKRVFQVSDVQLLPTMALGERALFEENGLRACLIVPVVLMGGIAGILMLASVRVQPFSADDIRFSQIIADLLVNTVHRVKAELTLRESEEKFRSLVTGLQDAVYVVSIPDGVCRYISPAAEQVLGYPADILMEDADLVRHVLHSVSGEAFSKTNSPFMQGRPVSNVFEYCLVGRDGKERWVRESSRIVYDSQGCPTAIEGICRNVTDEKQALQTVAEMSARLQEASKLSILGEIAANIAHEVNNPLAVISGSAEQLTSALQEPGQYPPETPQQLVHTISRNALRIRNMVKGLRNFSRDASQDPFEMALVKDIVEDSVALCTAHYHYHHIPLTVLGIPVALSIACRPTQILEILVNLLNNALMATRMLSEQWVELAVEVQETHVIFSVTDSGPGIPPDQQARIFEPFVTTRPNGLGTGLGLTIARNLALHHNGTLTLDTTCPHTRFLVRLPKHQETG